MNLIELEPGLLMRSVFSFSEIYSGSKVRQSLVQLWSSSFQQCCTRSWSYHYTPWLEAVLEASYRGYCSTWCIDEPVQTTHRLRPSVCYIIPRCLCSTHIQSDDLSAPTHAQVRHFGEIRRNSRVPYEEMIFFDDWDQNCKDVGKLGVTCVECRRVRTKKGRGTGQNRTGFCVG